MTGQRRLTPRAAAMLASDPGPYLSCEACFRLLDQYVEGVVDSRSAASDSELAAMPAHIASCAACREEAATVLLLVAEDRGLDGEALLAALGMPN